MITKGMGIAANGMMALIDTQDMIANNLANVNTTGFKKSNISFKNVYNAVLYENNSATDDFKMSSQQKVGELAMGPKAQQTLVDFSQGTLERTSNPLDFAIEGDGFFKIQTLDGDISYTRNGSFVLNNQRQLVTKNGDLVLDVLDKPISLDVRRMNIENMNDLVVLADGRIQTNKVGSQRFYQQIKVCDFRNRTELSSIGQGKFVPREGAGEEIRAEKFTIEQGALEAANSNTVNEMINMINVSRSYETLSKFVKNDSTMLTRAINLGRVSSV